MRRLKSYSWDWINRQPHRFRFVIRSERDDKLMLAVVRAADKMWLTGNVGDESNMRQLKPLWKAVDAFNAKPKRGKP